MKLIRCHIENFGNLRNFDYEFSQGLNVLKHENGWGKSTLAAFISVMFYGFGDSKARTVEKNLRKKYKPWDGGAFGGSIEFGTADGEFRIERFAGDKNSDDTFELTDLKTGLKSDRYSDNVGLELFGVDRAAYESSAFISNGRIPAEKEGLSDISERLSGLMDAVEDMNRYDDAISALEKKQKYYDKTGNRGRLAELESEIAQADREIDAAKADLDRAEKNDIRVSELKRECSDISEKLKSVRADTQKAEKYIEIKRSIDNCDSILKSKRDAEKSVADCSGFFKGNIPDREQMNCVGEIISKIRELTASEKSCRLTDSELDTYERLKSRSFPDDSDIEECGRLSVENIKLEGKLDGYKFDSDKFETLNARRAEFKNGIPDFEGMYAVEAEIAAKKQYSPTPSGRILKAIGAVSSFTGLTVTLIGIILHIWGLIAAVLLIPIGIFIVCKKPADIVCKESESELRLSELLSAYGIKVADGNYKAAIGTLSKDAEEFSRLSDEFERNSRNRDCISAQIKQNKERIAEILGDGCFDVADEISKIKLDRQRLAVLSQRVSEADKRKSHILNDIETAEKALDGFFSEWYILGQNQIYNDLFTDLKNRLEQLENAKSHLKSVEETVSRFNFADIPDVELPENLPNPAELSALADSIQTDLESKLREAARLEKQVEDTYGLCACLPDLESKRERLVLEKEDGEKRLRAVISAIKYIKDARNNLSSRYILPMREYFGLYFDKLAAGRELEYSMDTSFEVKLRIAGKFREESGFSSGWRDAVGLCIRFAFIDALFKDEPPPIILDDPFVNLDDGRLGVGLELTELISQKYQTLYLTCVEQRMPKGQKND